jgi:3-carboxy-cis,cis-muconate cycloisomerase
MLVLRQARAAIRADHERLAAGLRGLADAHASTVMLGRTLLQPAGPITFGRKAAGWWAAISRSWLRLDEAWDAALVLQFGGAAGTRAAAGPHGGVVARLLAAELELAEGPPWHTDRDRLGALVTACGLYTAALGKVARDVSLLMQAEVGEVSEPGGGSSSMPHKRNPAGCTIALAAAARMPGLVSAMLAGMVQEHERSTGGSQAEWPTISAVVQSMAAAAQAMADVFEGLTVDPDRMRRNLEATRGSIFAERAMTMLRPIVGRDKARTLVTQALQESRATGRSFGEALSSLPEAASALTPDALRDLEVPERYLGEAEEIRKRLLEAAGRKPEAGS